MIVETIHAAAPVAEQPEPDHHRNAAESSIRVDVELLGKDGAATLVLRDDGRGVDDMAKLVTFGASGWDERTVAAVLDHAGADGGWWCFFSNLVAKYGAVPAEVMPEVRSSGNTAEMNRDLATVVRRAAAQDGPREEILAQAREAAETLLSNPVIEDVVNVEVFED